MGRIVVVGCNNHHNDDLLILRSIATWLAGHGKAGQAARILADDLDHYDMSTRPEKGDALDAIREDVELVIALHLFGIDGRQTGVAERVAWGYNRNNVSWLKVCTGQRIPLISAGDQPMAFSGPNLTGFDPRLVKRTQLDPKVWMYDSAS